MKSTPINSRARLILASFTLCGAILGILAAGTVYVAPSWAQEFACNDQEAKCPKETPVGCITPIVCAPPAPPDTGCFCVVAGEGCVSKACVKKDLME
jgi:hypothetical protein